MAALDSANRTAVNAQLGRDFVFANVSKQEALAAVAAVDDWIELNLAALNLALPTAFRTSATPAQKALLYAYVFRRKAGNLKVEGE